MFELFLGGAEFVGYTLRLPTLNASIIVDKVRGIANDTKRKKLSELESFQVFDHFGLSIFMGEHAEILCENFVNNQLKLSEENCYVQIRRVVINGIGTLTFEVLVYFGYEDSIQEYLPEIGAERK
jgi:hypothetical protein